MLLNNNVGRQLMRISFPVYGSLAVVLLLLYFAGVTSLLPPTPAVTTLCLFAIGCSLAASIVAVRSSRRFDRVCGMVVLAVLLILVLIALFVPAISHP